MCAAILSPPPLFRKRISFSTNAPDIANTIVIRTEGAKPRVVAGGHAAPFPLWHSLLGSDENASSGEESRVSTSEISRSYFKDPRAMLLYVNFLKMRLLEDSIE